MSLAAGTYGSSILDAIGVTNVYADGSKAEGEFVVTSSGHQHSNAVAGFGEEVDGGVLQAARRNAGNSSPRSSLAIA